MDGAESEREGTHLECEIVVGYALVGGVLEGVGAFEAEVIEVDRTAVPGGEYAQNLCFLSLLGRCPHLRQQVVHEGPPRIVVRRELAVDALLRLGPTVEREEASRDDEVVDRGELELDFLRRCVHVAHESDIAGDEGGEGLKSLDEPMEITDGEEVILPNRDGHST